jgi:hypothetical protein
VLCLRFGDLVLDRERFLGCLLTPRSAVSSPRRTARASDLETSIAPKKSGTFQKEPGGWRISPGQQGRVQRPDRGLLVRLDMSKIATGKLAA